MMVAPECINSLLQWICALVFKYMMAAKDEIVNT
jgi:hypothetical protein